MSEATKRQSSAWRRFWRGVWLFILWLIRLIIAIGAGVLLGGAIFYVARVGVPQFYAQVLNPIQVNSAKVDILQSDLQSTRVGLNEDLRAAREEIRTLRATVSEQMAAINTLSAELEAEKANRNQVVGVLQQDVQAIDKAVQQQTVSVAKVETDVSQVQDELSSTASQLMTEIESQDAQIEDLSAEFGELESQTETIVAEVADLEDGLDAAQADITANAARDTEMAATVEALQQNIADFEMELQTVETQIGAISDVITMPVTLSEAFSRRLVLMQAWQEILKARVHLLERNAGFAAESLQLAMNNVDRFLALSPDISAEDVAPIMVRMETVAGAIEEDPFLALQELEIVWHSLETLISRPIIAEGNTGESVQVEESLEAPVDEEAAGEETAGEGEAAEEETTEEEGAGETEEETTEEESTGETEGETTEEGSSG